MLIHRNHSSTTLRSCQPCHKKICIYTAAACVVQRCNTVGAVCKNAVTHCPAYHIVAVLVCRYGCEAVVSTIGGYIMQTNNLSCLLVKTDQTGNRTGRIIYGIAAPYGNTTSISKSYLIAV